MRGGIAFSKSCPEWGVYSGSQDPLWAEYAWLGGTPLQIEADVLKVGKLDGNTIGPYANKNPLEIALIWPLLRSAKPDYGIELKEVEIPGSCLRTVTDCLEFDWFILLGIPTKKCIKSHSYCILETAWQPFTKAGEVLAGEIINEDPILKYLTDRLGQELYEGALNRYVEILATIESKSFSLNDFFFGKAAYQYKSEILEAQIAEEREIVKEMIMRRINEGKKNIIIEIANEPNLFPYIPPVLYAKYYVDWVHAIKDDLAEYQKDHYLPDFDLKFMPGGLADVSSMAKPIKELLSNGIAFNILGWELGFSQETNDITYYKKFLQSVDAYEKAKYNGTGAMDIIDYGNVHLYPMARLEFVNPDGSIDSVTVEDLASDYNEKMNLLATHSKSGQIIISEYGNITPYSESKVTEQVMKPLVNYISTRSDVKSAYWFLASGVDDKYSNMSSLPASNDVPIDTRFTQYFTVARIMNYIQNHSDLIFDLPGTVFRGTREIVRATEYMTWYKKELEKGHPNGPDQDEAGNDILAAFAQLTKSGQYTLLGDTYKKLTGSCFLSNTQLQEGNPAAFSLRKSGNGSTWIDPELKTKAIVVNSRPATKFYQSRGDWSFQHTFIFDESWASANHVDIEIFIDPTDLGPFSWLGTLRIVTFDGFKWLELNEDALGSTPPTNDLHRALGKWHTMRFTYDPSQYQLGQSFDLIFFVNAHDGFSSGMQYSLGRVSIANSDIPDSSNNSKPTTPIMGCNGKALDELTDLSYCNQCSIINVGERKAIAVEPNGGGSVIEFSVIADQALVNSRKISLDLKTNYTPESWNEVYFVTIDPSSNRYWDESRAPIPTNTAIGWSTIQANFNGFNYQVGDRITFKISLNTNVPWGKQITVNNLRWDP